MIKMYVSMRYKKYFCMIYGDKLVEIQKFVHDKYQTTKKIKYLYDTSTRIDSLRYKNVIEIRC